MLPNMNGSYKAAEDLLSDASFRKWVLNPDPDTAAQWESWLAMHTGQLEAVEEAKALLSSVTFEERTLSDEDSTRILAFVLENKEPVHDAGDAEAKVFALFPQVSQWAKFAAVISFFVLGSLFFYLKLKQEDKVQYATNYGEIKTITLPDSSKVTLNSNSKLTVPEGWGSGKEREVWLEGEGFFEVLKKAPASGKGHVKFVVHTQSLDVEVLGTQFNVKERATETRVVLNSGSIKLKVNDSEETSPVYMIPGESVELLKQDDREVKKELVNPARYSYWKDRKLVLDNTSVAELAHVLKDIYGLEVKFENQKSAQRVLNGSLPTDDKDALLHALSLALGGTFEVRGQEVIFKE